MALTDKFTHRQRAPRRQNRLNIGRQFAGGRLPEFVAVIPSRLEVAPQGSTSPGIADPRDGLRVEAKRFVDRQSG